MTACETGDLTRAESAFREALEQDPADHRAKRALRLLESVRRAEPRPRAVLDDVEAFLGEALRAYVGPDLRAWSSSGMWRTSALALAFGQAAVQKALTGRTAERGPAARVGIAAGTAVAAVVTRRLVPGTLGGAAAVGAAVGAAWLVASRKITPTRRRYSSLVMAARREWEADRRAWIEGQLARAEREARVERQIVRLCLLLDSD